MIDRAAGPCDAGRAASVAGAGRPVRYVVVSPCRDEAAFCRTTLVSVVQQTVRPSLWVIVDDGSTDATPAFLAEFAARHGFIRIVRREDRGRRSVGPGVVDAFRAGYATVDPLEFDYVCKLDLDLELPPTYFERLFQRMAAEPRLGTCSGKPWYRSRSGRLVSEAIGDEMSAGMTKLYRRECFEAIGGLVPEVMWDGIDCHRCRMLGWIACSWNDPELAFVHLRAMGASDQGVWTGRKRHGRGQWFMGTGPIYMLASSLYRMAHRPFGIGGLGMLVGYLTAMWQRQPRYGDAAFRRYLRTYQRDCLLLGKRRATERIHRRLRGGEDHGRR